VANTFRLEELDNRLAILTFDQPGSKVNTLSRSVLEELAELVAGLQERQDLRGLVLQSGKQGQFIAGADLNDLAGLADVTQEEAGAILARGRELFDQVSRLPWPTVALIDGPCLGGGTELVLAMDYRLASNGPKTQIALPEVKVGIIPSWGGTQRLPRLIGMSDAIDMICSGEPVTSEKAAALGLVSDVVAADQLVEEGCRLIEHAQQSGEWQQQRHRRQLPVALGADQLSQIFATAESDLKRKTKGHYPAPLVALRAIREGCTVSLAEGLTVEHAAAMEVAGSRISANLIAVFFMKQRLGRDAGVADTQGLARQVDALGVLGAGLMGSGIAAAHACCGIRTAMVDVDQQRVADGLARAKAVVAGRIEASRATDQDMADMLAKLSTSTAHEIFADCDLVVEAISEDETQKTQTYRALAGVLGDNAILASNTSTISITRLAESAPSADRFLGLHFFNPVDRMPLVEVIRGDKTGDEAVATAVALAKRIGKTPIVVRDRPGFLVNRVLFPYLNEAVLLLLEGASMDSIDQAATRFGMPMGPLLLNDVIGLDTVCSANRVLLEAQGDRAVHLPILADLVEQGRLGQKSAAGFRKYETPQSKGTPDPDFQPLLDSHRTDTRETREIGEEEITDRLFLAMLLEATRVLEEGVVREPAHVDMGLILGIGFPTFRGGILRWCDAEGAQKILRRVERYTPLGRRFEPTDILKRQASSAARFYPRP
jgi:3-hydroxyacyl-CoA dehydrogenase/enoyl-CoA hydratase/3-hydroxybutyryl-CoA epimerase/3-hydroxyacyl-CoA dehydrogenase/enoyl-CoA hydratase/3-hydroxybutyryl-CoA epimerase/enoyl-CoA isomerase